MGFQLFAIKNVEMGLLLDLKNVMTRIWMMMMDVLLIVNLSLGFIAFLDSHLFVKKFVGMVKKLEKKNVMIKTMFQTMVVQVYAESKHFGNVI